MPNCFKMIRRLRPGQLLILLLPVFLTACKTPVQEKQEPGPDPVMEEFVRVNRYMYRRHQDHIAGFVERMGWQAEVTPTGLWIVVEDPGTGPRISENDRVVYTYTSTLLDGTPCYEATEKDPAQIIIGKGGVEAGVEEGMRRLREGSRAIFLIPPHLAHGNFGDREKIPGNSVLIYRVVVKEVKKGL
jgi:FKBP-type peptidyl-prolyl cis-trans isomerase FkpA